MSINGTINQPRRILVAGASGFVGRALISALQADPKNQIRALSRKPLLSLGEHPENVEVMEGDALDIDSLRPALQNIDFVYYLIHSLDRDDFAESDPIAASNLAGCAADAGAQHLIYLGALGSSRGPSSHLNSRYETGMALRSAAGEMAVTELRASLIVGPGNAALKILEEIIDRFPVLPLAEECKARLQPISLGDVVRYLVGALEDPEVKGKILEIGGDRIFTYEELIRLIAHARGRASWITRMPWIGLDFWKVWIDRILPDKKIMAQALVEGMGTDMVVEDSRASQWLSFEHEPVENCLSQEPVNVESRRSSRWTPALLDAMGEKGDPELDGITRPLMASGEIQQAYEMVASCARNGESFSQWLPAPMQLWLEKSSVLPTWADSELIHQGQDLFRRRGWEVALGLFCASLPHGYSIARCARIMCRTRGMTTHVHQRIFEIGQFLFDMLEEGAWGPEGKAIRTGQRIRLRHSMIRQGLLRAGFHSPINQEDLAGTLLLFSSVIFDVLRKTIPPTEEEGRAWQHTWNVIGHALGIDESLLPDSIEEGDEFLEVYRCRHAAATPEGRELTQSLIAMMQKYYPEKLAFVPMGLIRHFAGDDCADIHGLPKVDWSTLGELAISGVMEISATGSLSEKVGRGLSSIARLISNGMALDPGVKPGRLLSHLIQGPGTGSVSSMVSAGAHWLMRGMIEAEKQRVGAEMPLGNEGGGMNRRTSVPNHWSRQGVTRAEASEPFRTGAQ